MADMTKKIKIVKWNYENDHSRKKVIEVIKGNLSEKYKYDNYELTKNQEDKIKELLNKEIKELDDLDKKKWENDLYNFIWERICNWNKPIITKSSGDTQISMILWTFPWEETLKIGGNLYYLDSSNIFWLLVWIIYNNIHCIKYYYQLMKISNEEAIIKKLENVKWLIETKGIGEAETKKSLNKIKDIIKEADINKINDDIENILINSKENIENCIENLKTLIEEIKESGLNLIIRDSVEICYCTKNSSLDWARCPLVLTSEESLKKYTKNKNINNLQIITNGTPMKEIELPRSSYTIWISTSWSASIKYWIKLYYWIKTLFKDIGDKDIKEKYTEINLNIENYITSDLKELWDEDDLKEILKEKLRKIYIWFNICYWNKTNIENAVTSKELRISLSLFKDSLFNKRTIKTISKKESKKGSKKSKH